MEVIKQGKVFGLSKAENGVFWITQNGRKTNQFWFGKESGQACLDRLNGLS